MVSADPVASLPLATMGARALIVAGGSLYFTPQLTSCLEDSACIIAADSGVRHVHRLGLRPDIIVGDFDSAAEATLQHFAGVTRQHHPPKKNFLDIELAIAIAQRWGYQHLRLLAVTGGRLDQSLAALMIVLRLRQAGVQLSLHSGQQDVYPLVAGDVQQLCLPAGTLFSVLAMDVHSPAILTVTGADYPLMQEELGYGYGRGVSNRVDATEQAEVRLEQGLALLIVEHYPDGMG